mmetsp:Transcript_5908/g.7769  ORF Transcript_5908/g.7769 Transcript_5908/m.7769 type:complete len:336 (+) Transcript_5908:36-1043(+)
MAKLFIRLSSLLLWFGLWISCLFGKTPTLELIREAKIAELLDKSGDFEASGLTLWNDTNQFLVAFDNRDDFGVFDGDLDVNQSYLLGHNYQLEGYEGMTFDYQGRNIGQMEFFSIEESVLNQETAQFQSILLTWDNDFNLIDKQWLETDFQSNNKGFEGISLLRYQGELSDRYLFAICEGNKCEKGSDGEQGGDGRVHVFAQVNSSTNWSFIDTVKMPDTLLFTDYSGIDIDGDTIAVLSQTDSKLWIGTLGVKPGDDFYIVDDGDEYQFPLDDEGNIIYCNVEGIAFVNPHNTFPINQEEKMFYFCSDKMKKSEQNDRCEEKDQMVHVFQLPSR